jgi:hypothetical protein
VEYNRWTYSEKWIPVNFLGMTNLYCKGEKSVFVGYSMVSEEVASERVRERGVWRNP